MGEVTLSIYDKLPKLYGAIILIFDDESRSRAAIELLPKNVEVVQYSNLVEVVYQEIDNIESWEIDDLLTQLFTNCDLNLICNLISGFNARVLIDISFHHFSKYPSLIFEGHNMQIIHKLQAELSIDPY